MRESASSHEFSRIFFPPHHKNLFNYLIINI